MSTIKLKRSGETGSVPSPDDLVQGELSINYADNKLFALSHDNVTVVDLLEIGERVGVATFNGLSGDVFGVGSFNGLTGAVQGVSAWNGLTGNVDVTNSVIHVGGISAGSGATFAGLVKLIGGLSADAGATFAGLVNFKGGISADSGATFGGNIVVPEDAWVGRASDDERIVFNGDGGVIVCRTETLDIQKQLRHYGDSNTYLEFTTDDVTVQAGGNEFLHGTSTYAEINTGFSAAGATFTGSVNFEAGISADGLTATKANLGGVTFAGGEMTVGDIWITEDSVIKVQGDTESILFNGNGGQFTLSANAVDIGRDLRHSGDADTELSFNTNDITIQAGGYQFLHGTSSGVGTLNVGGVTFGTGGGATFSGNIVLPTQYAQIGPAGEGIQFNAAGNQMIFHETTVDILQKLRHYGDPDTYLNFTTNNISLQAGGTDVLNITSTGADFGDQQVLKPKLKDYSETALATSSKSASFNVDFESGNVQSFTFADDLTVSFTNPPASGSAGTVTLIITNGGANTTTWNAAVKWPGDNAPALTASGVDIVSFMTIDAGTTVYGFVGGINFS